jgi:PAS domain S-box-containing protein
MKRFDALKELPIFIYKAEATLEKKGKFRIQLIDFFNLHLFREKTGWEVERLKEPNFWFENVHENDKEKIYNTLANLKNGQVVSYDYRFRKKDGTYIFLQDTFHVTQKKPLTFENTGIIQDITKIKVLERKEKEDTHLLSVFLHHTPLGVVMYDKNGIFYVNKRFEDITGYTLHELKEKNVKIWDFFFSKEAQEEERNIVRRRIKGDVFTKPWKDVKLRTKDGKTIFAEVIGNTLNYDDKYVGVVIINDITIQYQYQREIQKLYNKLKEFETYRTDFLRSISHELKTPLNVIYGNVQLLEMNFFEDEKSFKDSLSSIKKSVENATALVNNLLDLSKLESKSIKVRAEIITPSIFKETIREYKALAEQKGLDFSFENKLPPTFSGDPKMLSPILSNLLNNAVKYTDNGWVKGSMKIKDGFFTIEVKDSGKGIPAKLQKKIFEPFTSLGGTGSGLGLAVIKKFVEVLKGKIELQSEVGKGTRICIKIPTVSRPSFYETKEKKEVLIVEPDEETRKMLKSVLRNYEMIEAETAKDAYLKALEHRPDLVISDLVLPDESGKQLIKQLSSEPELTHTNFLIYTGAKFSEEEEEVKIIEKGRSIADLRQELNDLLHKKVMLAFEKTTYKYIKKALDIVHLFTTKEVIVKDFEDITDKTLYLYDTFVILVPDKMDLIKEFTDNILAITKRGIVIFMIIITKEGELNWRI